MNEIHGYVGAYVANALDLELGIVFAEHLVDCESCSREVREFGETLALLSAVSAARPPASLRGEVRHAVTRIRIDPPEEPPRHDPVGPPDSVRDDVITAVHRIPAGRGDDDQASDAWPWKASSSAPTSDPSQRATRWLSLAVAASVIMVMLVGGWAVTQQRRLDQIERAQRAAQPAAELLRAADLQTRPITWPDRTRGSFLVSRQLNQVLLTGAVPAVAPGRTYQLWAIRSKDALPGPTFQAGTVAIWDIDLTGVRAVAITSEPEGGSTHPDPTSWGTEI